MKVVEFQEDITKIKEGPVVNYFATTRYDLSGKYVPLEEVVRIASEKANKIMYEFMELLDGEGLISKDFDHAYKFEQFLSKQTNEKA